MAKSKKSRKTTKKTKKPKAARKAATKKGVKRSVKAKATPKRTTKAKAVKTAKPKVAAAAPKTELASLNVGDTVPDIALQGTGTEFKLSEMRGQKVVLYFYPKDMTPGCTVEGHEFSALKDEFESNNAKVYGVSRDSVDSHKKFIQKEGYTVDLLSDSGESACSAFGVIKDKNMYGKMVKGVERSTFLIDEEGRLAKAWRGVKVEGHAQEVLNAVKGEA